MCNKNWIDSLPSTLSNLISLILTHKQNYITVRNKCINVRILFFSQIYRTTNTTNTSRTSKTMMGGGRGKKSREKKQNSFVLCRVSFERNGYVYYEARFGTSFEWFLFRVEPVPRYTTRAQRV